MKAFAVSDKGIESGTAFNQSKKKFGWPRLYVSKLNINMEITDSYIDLLLPEGEYDFVLYADGYLPIHHSLKCKSQKLYTIKYYMGFITEKQSNTP